MSYDMIDRFLRNNLDDDDYAEYSAALDELCTSPAQQEPVAWLHWLHGPVRLFMNKDEAMMELDRLNREYPVDSGGRQMKPLYTTPPAQRTWVGLTAKDWNVIGFTAEFRAGAKWANDKLKEKNT